MDRKVLESYPQLLQEIKDVREELNLLMGGSVVTDLVSGSMLEFPYLKRGIVIHGVPDSEPLQRMRERLESLLRLQKRIEDFVEKLPNLRIRRVVRLKALKGLSWEEIARRVGGDTSPEAARSLYRRAIP